MSEPAAPPGVPAGGAATEIDSAHICLACESRSVETFLDLGRTALANRFLSAAELERSEARYPLRVGYCRECGHVQLTDRVPPGTLFSEYLYISSASDTLNAHFAELSATLVRRHRVGADDLVIDIGCNDASLLACFRRLGVRTLGVDPATNLAVFPGTADVERYVGFFDAPTARIITARWGRASLVTATNTFPHIPHLADFLKGIDTVLAPGGAFVIECHYLVDLLDQLAFDTIYHEHVSYWALGPMVRLLRRHGFDVVRAERLPLHHGQLRATVRRAGEAEPDPSVREVLAHERERGIGDPATYRAFAERSRAIKNNLVALLADLTRGGRRIAAYGAPAKGSTLLEYLQIGPSVIEYVVDRSPLKQGRYTPGSHVPITAPERLLTDPPDYVLLLAWNFADEILEQQAAYRARGGRFILPVPEVRII